jgi:hypothetical protein
MIQKDRLTEKDRKILLDLLVESKKRHDALNHRASADLLGFDITHSQVDSYLYVTAGLVQYQEVLREKTSKLQTQIHSKEYQNSIKEAR